MEMPLRSSIKTGECGPGGLNCPCCRAWSRKSAAKQHNSRVIRRAARIAVRLNARNSED